jgi:hypothetical protein
MHIALVIAPLDAFGAGDVAGRVLRNHSRHRRGSQAANADNARLDAPGARGIARPKLENVHVIVGPEASKLGERLRALPPA